MAMNKAYIPTLIILILMAVLHYFASIHHFYIRFYGFDIFMHILGGAGLACAIYWILVTFFPGHALSFFKLVILTVIAGIIWEGIETANDIAGAPVGTLAYYVDTVKDLFDDLLGALIAVYFLKK